MKELNYNQLFEKELEILINKYSKENDSNTPDFILAEYLSNCLKTFNTALQKRAHWYSETGLPINEATNCKKSNLCEEQPAKKYEMGEILQDEAIKLENAASDHNYHFYCARATLGISKAITPYELLDNDYCRVRSAIEKQTIRNILRERNVNCDTSNNAYNDWEITLVKTNGYLCGHNGKSLPPNSTIETVKVRDKFYGIGQRVKNDGVIERFCKFDTDRVEAIVAFNHKYPFHSYFKSIDIVNL
jgi:hypothetical protein